MSKIIRIDRDQICYVGIDGNTYLSSKIYIATDEDEYTELQIIDVLNEKLAKLGFTPQVDMEVETARDALNGRIWDFWPVEN